MDGGGKCSKTSGEAWRIRTSDSLLKRQELYQAELTPHVSLYFTMSSTLLPAAQERHESCRSASASPYFTISSTLLRIMQESQELYQLG